MTQLIDMAAGAANAAPPRMNGRTGFMSIGTSFSSGSSSFGIKNFSSNFEVNIICKVTSKGTIIYGKFSIKL